ncbi:MAG: MGDG synthase family glycosyltransferase [Planctomycetota bacterium]
MAEQTSESHPPRVLLLSASVGAGHNAAARAILQGLADSDADVATGWMDAMDWAPRWFRAYYAGGFALSMTRLPRAYGVGFRLTDRPHRPGRSPGERLRLCWERRAMRRLADRVQELQPELIINTHFVSTPIVGRLIRQGRLTCRQVVVVTDNIVHRWWYARNVEHWFLPAEKSVEPLRAWGIDRDRLTVSGIPIHPKWYRPLDETEIRREWHLPPDRPVVLLSGGAVFTVGPIVDMARELLEQCPEICLVVLAGRNKQPLADLTRLPQADGRLVPLGYTDRMHELGHVASLMITKAGGITTAECLVKGTPMLLFRPVPGQEAGNAEHLAEEDAATIIRDPQAVAPAVRDLLDRPERLAELSSNCRRLSRPGTHTIVRHVLDMLAGRS